MLCIGHEEEQAVDWFMNKYFQMWSHKYFYSQPPTLAFCILCHILEKQGNISNETRLILIHLQLICDVSIAVISNVIPYTYAVDIKDWLILNLVNIYVEILIKSSIYYLNEMEIHSEWMLLL